MSFCGMDGFTKRLWEPGRHVIISYTVYTWLYRDYQAGRIKDMLITIQQVKSNFENLFEVSSSGQVLFRAKAPWMDVSLPFSAEHMREIIFTDASGEKLYTTHYKLISNMIEEAIPFKYLITKEQRFGQFEIVGRDGNEGSFYIMQNGVCDNKFCIEHKGRVCLGYSIDKGKNNYVSIYENDTQIAQITKPLTVIDNLDVYYLHIKDGYASMVPVLCFFTVYYDYRKYNNSGRLTRNSVEISISYTYGRNNDKYNPNWIAQEFGQGAADELEQMLGNLAEQGSAQARRIVKIVGMIFLVLILLAVVLFFVLRSIPG